MKDIKKQCWEDFDLIIQNVPQSEKLFTGGDFDSYIGMKAVRYDTAHGDFGYGERNNGGVSILNFAVGYELLVANSYFKRTDDHLVTFKSYITNTQIDYFFIRTNNRKVV